jgi:hypothetical protein
MINILTYEGFINESATSFSCVHELFREPLKKLKGEGYDSLLLKASLGIIGRESTFGDSKRYMILNPIKTAVGSLGLSNTSSGFGQVSTTKAKELGIDMFDLNTPDGALGAVYKILKKNYEKAISAGYSKTSPSSNFSKGTGNAALDISIMAYNSGSGKIMKYCDVQGSNLKRDCSLAGKSVEIGNKKYTVKSTVSSNYLPNYKTERWDNVEISSHGYVEEVATWMKKMNCF